MVSKVLGHGRGDNGNGDNNERIDQKIFKKLLDVQKFFEQNFWTPKIFFKFSPCSHAAACKVLGHGRGDNSNGDDNERIDQTPPCQSNARGS